MSDQWSTQTWLSPPVPVLSESLLDIYVESDSVEPIDPTASGEREGSFWVVAAGPEVDIPHPSSGLGAGEAGPVFPALPPHSIMWERVRCGCCLPWIPGLRLLIPGSGESTDHTLSPHPSHTWSDTEWSCVT